MVFLLGALSALLYVGLNLKILRWIDAGGPEMGWTIRGGIMGAGVLLVVVSVLMSLVLPKPKKPADYTGRLDLPKPSGES